ncbi:MAG: hypothetical protein HYR55_07150 [Acidobacteria bacterium]|nr:hypothetical protein [Acidobacteriota bacterium]
MATDFSNDQTRPTAFLSVTVLVLLFITTLPYIICYRGAPAHQLFTGVLFVPSDTDSYYAWMNQARHGQWLFENKYQTQHHAGAYFNVLWFTLGSLARLLNIPLDWAWHIGRLASGALLVVAFYGISGFWITKPALRAGALLLFIFGGGFGWAIALLLKVFQQPDVMHMQLSDPGQVLMFNLSMDLWAGFHPFFQVFLATHFAFAHALFLTSLYFFLQSERKNSAWTALMAGIALLMLALTRPYDAVTAIMTCALYTLFRFLRPSPPVDQRLFEPEKYSLPEHERRFVQNAVTEPKVNRPPFRDGRGLWDGWALWRLTLTVGPPALGLGYYLWLFKFHEYFKLWGKGARSIEPNVYILLSLGLCGIFGLFQGLRRLINGKAADGRLRFLLCWLLSTTTLFCSYPILKFSGQFGLVFMGPLVLLTVLAIQSAIDRRMRTAAWSQSEQRRALKRRLYAAGISFLLLNTLSSPVLLVERTLAPEDYYLDESIALAMQWLDQNTLPHETVIASQEMGLKIPVYSHNYVFLGHPHLSDNPEQRRLQLDRFFSARENEAFRRALLREHAIAYVFYSRFESALGNFAPSGRDYLQEIYRNDSVAIYRVRPTLL